jgi:diguanylate cyclase (GGDEF)-like protein/PAS domain S-box-containing protein
MSMRARLLALTLVPLVGLTAFAALWTNELRGQARAADRQAEMTDIITDLSDLVLDIEIESTVSAATRGSGPGATASIGFVHHARSELRTLRADLEPHGSRIDELAAQDGGWARVADRLDTLTESGARTSYAGSHGNTAVGELSLIKQIGTAARGKTLANRDGDAAQQAVKDLIVRMGFVSDEETATVAAMIRASELEQGTINEVLFVLGHAAANDWDGTRADLAPLVAAQTHDIETLLTLVPHDQRQKLRGLVGGRPAAAWQAIRGAGFAAEATGVKGPSIQAVGGGAFALLGQLINYRASLSHSLRAAADRRSNHAHAEATAATLVAASFFLATLALGGMLAVSIRRSLRALDQTTNDLHASEAFARAIVTTAPMAIWTVAADGVITSANPGVDQLMGDGTSTVGRTAEDVLGHEIAAALGGDAEPLDNADIWLRRADGSRIPALVSTSRADAVWTVFARDISELKEYETRLSHQAFHDELTGLPNRALLLNRVEHALARARRDSHWGVALLMIDLDDFKSVNDALGHTAGDELLVSVADRLRSCLRPGDTAARLGGDEFAVLLEDTETEHDAHATAERLVEVLQMPLRAADRDLAISASVGLKIADLEASPQTLLRDADIAMYAAKSGGKARARHFTAAMHEDAARRLELRSDLANALDRDELKLVYQPMIELSTREIVAAEALLRWHHPEHGIVSPLEFIPLAEETGLIVRIGRWVLNEACRVAASWPDNGTPLQINVNVSGAQIAGDDVVDAVSSALDATGLPPERLVLELTESVLLDDFERVTPTLADLKALGVSIAIDDFGTGYSSLAYLKRFPVDHLKIDRAFIKDLGDTVSGEHSLARSIIDLAGVLGLSAVAEGVETADQADLLEALSCDFAQGFHFSRPIDQDELHRLIANGRLPSALGAAAAG